MATEDCALHLACRTARESASCASAQWRAATRQAAEGCANAGGAAATVPTKLPLRGSRASAKTTGRVAAWYPKGRGMLSTPCFLMAHMAGARTSLFWLHSATAVVGKRWDKSSRGDDEGKQSAGCKHVSLVAWLGRWGRVA